MIACVCTHLLQNKNIDREAYRISFSPKTLNKQLYLPLWRNEIWYTLLPYYQSIITVFPILLCVAERKKKAFYVICHLIFLFCFSMWPPTSLNEQQSTLIWKIIIAILMGSSRHTVQSFHKQNASVPNILWEDTALFYSSWLGTKSSRLRCWHLPGFWLWLQLWAVGAPELGEKSTETEGFRRLLEYIAGSERWNSKEGYKQDPKDAKESLVSTICTESSTCFCMMPSSNLL